MASDSSDNRSSRKRKRSKGGKGYKKATISFYKGPPVDCSICGKTIDDISSAIDEKRSQKPAHFDCVIQQITEQENLKEKEKIVYMGGGRFAVIQTEDDKNKNFTVIREIPYEEERDERVEWRDALKNEIL